MTHRLACVQIEARVVENPVYSVIYGGFPEPT